MSRPLVLSLVAALAGAFAPGLNAQSADVLKIQLANHQKRADLLKGEIRELDTRIEQRIERALAAIEAIKDTTESRTHAARIKGDTLDALKANLQAYGRKRADLEEELRNPRLNLSVEEKQRAIAMLDKRINRRIDQVIQLTQSFPPSKDVPKYVKRVHARDGDVDVREVINEDWRQNQRVSTHTRAAREEVEAGLRKSIEKLERQQRDTKARLSLYSGDAVAAMEEEIARIGTLIEARKRQLADLDAAPRLAAIPLDQKQSIKVQDAIKEAGPDLRRDMDALFARYNELLVEVSRIHTLEAALGVPR